MKKQNRLPDFGVFMKTSYNIDYKNNLISIRSAYITNLILNSSSIITINGSIILDTTTEYGISIEISKQALDKFLKVCNDFIPFNEWITSNKKNIPLHITEEIVFDFIGELILKEDNKKDGSIIPFKAEQILVKKISEPIYDSRKPTLTHSDFNCQNTFITLPKYHLKKSWLDGWFERGLHRNPRRNPITKDCMSEWIHTEILDNEEAEYYSKIKVYKNYLNLGFSEEESRSMAGL